MHFVVCIVYVISHVELNYAYFVVCIVYDISDIELSYAYFVVCIVYDISYVELSHTYSVVCIVYETWSKFSRLWPVYMIMKLLPRYLRATNTPGDTREKFSLEEPGLTYERTSSQSELARCGINYQKRWLWQKTSTHSSDYWTSIGKTTPADTIIR